MKNGKTPQKSRDRFTLGGDDVKWRCNNACQRIDADFDLGYTQSNCLFIYLCFTG